MSSKSQAIARFELYASDWRIFAREYLRVSLDPEQEEALFIIQHSPKVAIASGTSRGKDYLMAVAALCFLYLTPRWDNKGNLIANTKVVLTAPTARQVKEIMMPEISRIFRGSIYLPGELTSNRISTNYEEWFLTAFKADDASTEAWTGFHAVNIFFGVTEATGLPQSIFNAIEGNLQGNSRLVLAFNPNVNHGYAANAMKSPSFKHIRLSSLNAPNVVAKKIIIPAQVNYDWVHDRVHDWCIPILESEILSEEGDFPFEGRWYRPNDLFRAKVLALFPRASEGVLIPEEWISVANENWKLYKNDPRFLQYGFEKPLRLGVDVAGMGRDSSCFCHRYGNIVERFNTIHSGGTANHMEIAGNVLNIMQWNLRMSNNIRPQAFIDTIGEGAGVFSRLQELKVENVYSCKFSEAAYWNGAELKDVTGQYQFLNMRAYLYWALRDWLNPANKNKPCLPPDDELLQELTETQWKFMSNGKIQIEPKEEIKKRLKRSPDKADALANTFYPVPDVDPNKKKTNIANYFR